jgi:cholinesterase
MALEWVRDNIEAFGGDPEQITMFGQSQGAWVISYYSYAFANNSIAQAFIQESGSGFADLGSTADVRAEVWRNASASVGCAQSSDSLILECMRAQNVSTVLAAMQLIPLVGPAPTFGPLIDEQVVFSNYTEKTLAGGFAQKVICKVGLANSPNWPIRW